MKLQQQLDDGGHDNSSRCWPIADATSTRRALRLGTACRMFTMAFGDTSLLKGLGASPKPGQVRALLDSIHEDVEAFSTVAYESARRWPRIALAVLLPRADEDTLDCLLSHADLALEKQTPMPSKMVFVREPLHLRAVSDGTELIVDGPAPTDLMEMVLAAAGPAITRIDIRNEAMNEWSEAAWAHLDRGAVREARLCGENASAVRSLLSGAVRMSTLRVEHAAMADDIVPPGLHCLELRSDGVVRTSLLRALATCPQVSHLIIGGEIDAEGMAALAALPALTELYAWSSNCGDAGARAIARAPVLSELALIRAGIGDDGAEALSTMPTLQLLWLSRNHIGGRGAAAIARMTELEDLTLDGNVLDDVGVRALAPLRGLSSLSVKDNPFTDPEAVHADLLHVAERVEVEEDPYAFSGVL